MEKEFKPFNDEWKAEMKKFNKEQLIEMFKKSQMKLLRLEEAHRIVMELAETELVYPVRHIQEQAKNYAKQQG